MVITKIEKEIKNKNFYTIFKEDGLDYKDIEDNNKEGWYKLQQPVHIPTHNGDSCITDVYYNGYKDTVLLTFSDGNTERCTRAHMFKCIVDGKEVWKEVNEISSGEVIVNTITDTITVTNMEDGGKRHTWDLSVKDVHEYILANGTVTHNSGSSIGVIESIEPVLNFSYELEGSVSGTVLVPEFTELNGDYELAYTIDQEILVVLAGIRQLWLDQSQSVNLYPDEKNWNYEYLMNLLLLANKIGVKTSYYLNTDKQDVKDICDSCM